MAHPPVKQTDEIFMKHLPLIAAVFLAAACVDRTVEPYSAGGLDLPDADLARQDRASTSREDKSGKGDNGPGCVHPKVVKDCKKDSQGVAWCTIPAGCFQMGSPETEKCRGSDETRHRVTLTHKF